jgi:hypothetical protein
MGNPSRPDLHPSVVEWGKLYAGSNASGLPSISPKTICEFLHSDLLNYFRLCALARSTTAIPWYVTSALHDIFRVRSLLERSIYNIVSESDYSFDDKVKSVLENNFFGFSKKQGTSLRLPLSSCNPTRLCAPGCYAHDVLDAAPFAVIRGALNGWLAGAFEKGDAVARTHILKELVPHAKSGIRYAYKELSTLQNGFKRRPFIRFSHVGEIVAFPDFANALAGLVTKLSDGGVDCVVYTRHRDASKLDPSLWIINFTLDPSSMSRKSWAPDHARIVFSAFGGVTSRVAEVNFLEHHRHGHTPKTAGTGRVCPATAPETIVRTCDACKCNRCFVKK